MCSSPTLRPVFGFPGQTAVELSVSAGSASQQHRKAGLLRQFAYGVRRKKVTPKFPVDLPTNIPIPRVKRYFSGRKQVGNDDGLKQRDIVESTRQKCASEEALLRPSGDASDGCLGATVNRRKRLGRVSINAFEFPAKMRSISEAQFQAHGLGGPTFGNQFERDAASQLARPLAGSFFEVSDEEALHLTQRDWAEGSHERGLKLCFPGEFFPILNYHQSALHRMNV
jgi:hypothetical protein